MTFCLVRASQQILSSPLENSMTNSMTNSMLVLQNFATARKSCDILSAYYIKRMLPLFHAVVKFLSNEETSV